MDIDLILEPDLTPAQITEIGQAAEKCGNRARKLPKFVGRRFRQSWVIQLPNLGYPTCIFTVTRIFRPIGWVIQFPNFAQIACRKVWAACRKVAQISGRAADVWGNSLPAQNGHLSPSKEIPIFERKSTP